MSVSAISSGNALNQSNMLQNRTQPSGTQFQQLTQALQTGNLSSAQQLFSALNNSATSSGLMSTQMQSDLSNLGSALQSGNLTGAQKAYSSVQQNVENSNHMDAHHNRPVRSGGDLQDIASGVPGTGSGIASDVFQALSLIV
jgi:outer membrane protein assembly factor BamD (BamD/ComL family)